MSWALVWASAPVSATFGTAVEWEEKRVGEEGKLDFKLEHVLDEDSQIQLREAPFFEMCSFHLGIAQIALDLRSYVICFTRKKSFSHNYNNPQFIFAATLVPK